MMILPNLNSFPTSNSMKVALFHREAAAMFMILPFVNHYNHEVCTRHIEAARIIENGISP